MTDPGPLRPFVLEALADLGATVSEGGSLVWVQLPEPFPSELEVPATFPIAFSPEQVGDFEAELVAPGSYFLEKLGALTSRRGRWDAARLESPDLGWIEQTLADAGLSPQAGVRTDPPVVDEQVLFLLSFRVSLVSDEKRESLHFLAAWPSEGFAWEVDASLAGRELIPWSEHIVSEAPDVAYRLASDALREATRGAVEGFRANNLRLLEEEVRRIFGYFDQTIDAIRASEPDGSPDLIRAVQAERDRRLTETLERFDPKASASLCAIRAIRTPTARVRFTWPDHNGAKVRLDAWSRHLDGLVCATCRGTNGPWCPQPDGMRCSRCAPTRGASAPLRGRPRSDTPRRRTQADRGPARSPRGSRGRSRSASARRRDP